MNTVEVVVTVKAATGEPVEGEQVERVERVERIERIERAERVESVERSRTRKTPISLTITPALLARVDQAAERLNMSRAAAIAYGLSKFCDDEEKGA
jgi:hypothetical protein